MQNSNQAEDQEHEERISRAIGRRDIHSATRSDKGFDSRTTEYACQRARASTRKNGAGGSRDNMVSGEDRPSLPCTRRTGWEEGDSGLAVQEVTEPGLVEFLIWYRYRWYEDEFFCFLCPYFDFFLEFF